MIEVFKTNIEQQQARQQVIDHLQLTWPQARVTIDINDCDRVLRFENTLQTVDPREIIKRVQQEGFYCEVLTH